MNSMGKGGQGGRRSGGQTRTGGHRRGRGSYEREWSRRRLSGVRNFRAATTDPLFIVVDGREWGGGG
jgi:hypothetical protein